MLHKHDKVTFHASGLMAKLLILYLHRNNNMHSRYQQRGLLISIICSNQEIHHWCWGYPLKYFSWFSTFNITWGTMILNTIIIAILWYVAHKYPHIIIPNLKIVWMATTLIFLARMHKFVQFLLAIYWLSLVIFPNLMECLLRLISDFFYYKAWKAPNVLLILTFGLYHHAPIYSVKRHNLQLKAILQQVWLM
jgi:hypothetical protein